MIDTPTNRTLGKYILGKTLGKGQFKVKAIRDPSSQIKYAAKICNDCLLKTHLAREAHVLSTVNQAGVPNVITIIDYIENKELPPPPKKKGQKPCSQKTCSAYEYKSFIIMELASNGTLFDFVDHSQGLNEKLARTYFKKLIATIDSLHKIGYVHRDIKLENILLDEKFRFRLSDFGFAKEFNESNKDKMATRLGTEYYMAPELHKNPRYSGVKIDMFACGVALFILLFGRPPFYKATISDPLYKFFCEETPERFWEVIEKKLNSGNEYNKGLKGLINDLIAVDPSKRPSAEQVFMYDWLQRDDCMEEELMHIMGKMKTMMKEKEENQ